MSSNFPKKIVGQGWFFIVVWGVVAVCAIVFNVYAGTYIPVTVNDDGKIQTYTTNIRDTQSFLEDEGIIINDGDVLDAPALLTREAKINITRSFDVEIITGGESRIVRTVPDTVKNILENNGISYDEDDVLSISEDEMLTESSTLNVDFIEVRIETEDVIVPSVTNYLNTTYNVDVSTFDAGENSENATPVSLNDAVKRATYEVHYVNGVETERLLADEAILLKTDEGMVSVCDNRPDAPGASSGLIASEGRIERYTKTIDVVATAYTHTGYVTATRTWPKVGTVAVDPSVIPLGSKLYIESADGESWIYGYCIAEDTGRLIKGNKIDLFLETKDECILFGIRDARVYILE
ncbi:MAG: DUF348 domain-containing protein [Clostridia bacterium]|nr:DUF348 domain-containing protein [Clostridia bacterium]